MGAGLIFRFQPPQRPFPVVIFVGLGLGEFENVTLPRQEVELVLEPAVAAIKAFGQFPGILGTIAQKLFYRFAFDVGGVQAHGFSISQYGLMASA